jgi:DNA-binding transcriptional regulator YiaG
MPLRPSFEIKGHPLGQWGQSQGASIAALTPSECCLLANMFALSQICLRFYATMELSNEATNGGKSPLVVEGMSPLDVAVKRFGLTIEAFCREMNVTSATYRKWRSDGLAHLDHVQAKKLDKMLRDVGLSIQDLPDSLARCPTQKAHE